MNPICRLCLKGITKENKMIPMIGIDSNGIEVTTLVKTLVPEVYIGLSPNPVLCMPCYHSLSDAYSFRLLCLRSENLIGIFMRETESRTQVVDLHRVVNYWKKVFQTNRRDVDATKANLAEWFGVDVQRMFEQNTNKPWRKLPSSQAKISKLPDTDKSNACSSELRQIFTTTETIAEPEPSKRLDLNALKEVKTTGLDPSFGLHSGPIDLCGCPPVHECPTNSKFNVFVEEKHRFTLRKKHAACHMLCEYRHMQTCKFYKKMVPMQPESETDTAKLDISDQPIENSLGSNVETITTEKPQPTCSAEETPEDKNDDEDDEIDLFSLFQQLQENEMLEKLGLMGNATNLQDLYVIQKIFDEKHNSFSYALIPKSVAEDQSVPKSNVDGEITNTEKANNKNDDSVARGASFSESPNALFTPVEIKKERTDEDVLGLILGVPPEVLPVTAAKPIEEVERTPLGSSLSDNPTAKRPCKIRVRPVESLKQCSLNDRPLPVQGRSNLEPELPSSVVFPSLLAGSVSPPPTIVGLIENNIPPPMLSPITDKSPEETVGSYVSQRPLYTTSSPPPLHMCASEASSSLSSSKKRKAPAAPKRPAKRRQTKKLDEANPEPLVPIPSLEMPTSMDAEDGIVIKTELLESSDPGDDLDKPSARRPSEDSNNLSKLIDDPLMNEEQLDIPEYIQIKNLSLVSISDVVPKDVQAKKQEPKTAKKGEPKKTKKQERKTSAKAKPVDNLSPIRLPQSLSELLDAKPKKSEPEAEESLDLLAKPIEDDPSYDADRDPLYLPPPGSRQRKRDFKRFIELSDEEKAKRMRRSNRVRRKKVDRLNLDSPNGNRRRKVAQSSANDPTKCVLPTKFTSDGDYVNDHDYFISPYARNRMASVRRNRAEHCICLLCDLIHLSSKHVDHMSAHYTTCAICNADFENVFVLNMHVRKHTSHCRECKLSVTYSRFLHHAETHNRTPGMSKILLPPPPTFPLSERDFLDDLQPQRYESFTAKRKICSPNPNFKKSCKKAAGKQTESDAFCKPSSITLTELLRSSRPTHMNSITNDKRSVSNPNGSTQKKTKPSKRRKKTKTGGERKPFAQSRLSKIVDDIVNTAKGLKTRRSEIIESHVYAKDAYSGDDPGNEYAKTYKNTKHCRKYKTASVSMQDLLDGEAIAETVENSSDETHLPDDASLKSTEPLGNNTATNSLDSPVKREVPIVEDAGFEITNKLTSKRPTKSGHAENVARNNPLETLQMDCYVDFSDMSSTGQITTKVLPTVKLLKDVEPVANLKALKETDESIKSLTSADEVLTPSSAAKKQVFCIEKVAKIAAYLKSNKLSTVDATVEPLAPASNDSSIKDADNSLIAGESSATIEATKTSLAKNILKSNE